MNVIPRASVFLVHRFFKSRYKLATLTRKHPRFGKAVRKIAFDRDDMSMVPKAGTAHRVVNVDIDVPDAGERNVLPSDLVKTVLRRSRHIFIMNFCLCRQSSGCRDYPVEKGCVFVGEGTLRIPPEYGRFVTPEEACDYIDECDRLGLVHIIGRNKLDSIWLHTGKKRDLMTICNCCPCCCLWNVLRDVDGGISSTFHRMPGVEVSVDTGRCIGCGVCAEVCFVKAVRIVDGRCSLDDGACRACGRCADQCPVDAIRIGYDPLLISAEADRICSLFNNL